MKDESVILEALRLEWRLACWDLPEQFSKRMHLPNFEVRELGSRWGIWHGERKLLAMNSRLIQTAGWPCIREVLRHEMAHQLADAAFHATETSHGDQFKEACRLLNADPRASGSLPSIYQWITEHEKAPDPRIEKVRKLLALAGSPHPHEAEAAMMKAHELTIRYNLNPLRTKGAEYVSICIGLPALRHSAADDALGAILRDFYFVETVYVSIAVPSVAKKGKILEISGTRENVSMATYVADFLKQSIKLQAGAKGIRGKRANSDYAHGFLKAVNDRLAGQRNTMASRSLETTALTKAGNAELHAYFRKRYPRLRTRYRGGRHIDKEAYSAGTHDGQKLVIHKPITSGPKGTGRMPGFLAG